MDKLLEVKQLTKVFSLGSMLSRVRITAVDNVSFEIKPAEIFALAGESGCGKSTTARMVLGFEEPTSGQIIHQGDHERKTRKVWKTEGIQAIFQDPFSTFNPLRLVDRYFFETVKHYKLAKSKEEAINLIDSLPRFGDKTTKESAPGSPPDLANLPSGCPFHPRCPYTVEQCTQQMPDLIKINDHHKVACWLITGEEHG